MACAEERSRCCVLECDGPGHLDARISAEPGRTMVVVRSYAASYVAAAMRAPAVTSFETALAAARDWKTGPCVVSDRAVKYVAGVATAAPDLVVLEGVDFLWLPSCPDLGGRTVWMTRFSRKRLQHRGWASECHAEAVRNDAVVRRRSKRAPGAVPVRDLYFDVRGVESDVTKRAVVSGDMELAVRSFPGSFERMPRERPDDECPICYDAAPSPRVTAMCCGRDFCLECVVRCMGDDTPCPWCRRESGLWNCSIECGHHQAPFKDVLLADLVRTSLASSQDAKVLVVTSDEVYTYRTDMTNPLAPFGPVALGGCATAVGAALAQFGASGRRSVAVTHADRMLRCGLTFPATHLIFTERDAFDGEKGRFWTWACPDAIEVRCMTAITDAVA